MNVIQTQLGLSEKVQGPNSNINFGNNQIIAKTNTVDNLDRVIKTSANDEIVAKVLSYSLGNTIANENENGKKQLLQQKSLSENNKLEAHQAKIKSISSDPKQFSVEKVVANVTNFITNALAKFIHSGHTEEQVTYYKNQAVAGVENGIQQAKKELDGLVESDVFLVVDKTKDKIISGIESFNIQDELTRFNSKINTTNINPSTTISIQSNKKQSLQISFDSQAIAHDKIDGETFSMTTSATNTLVSIYSENKLKQLPELADLINKTDDVLNTFYRKDIDSAYQKAVELGYSNEELLSQAKHFDGMKLTKQVEKYDQIKHLIEKSDSLKYEAPKALAEYINKYMNVLQSSSDLFSSREDFNQIINGIVNQMKDVQVPDLLHAINRFHSFNQKFDL